MAQTGARERRARREARRQGYMLVKSRTRDITAPSYAGWMILDPAIKAVIAGAFPHRFSLKLYEAEAWLFEPRAVAQLAQREGIISARGLMN
jgi:hypothetical protein